MQMIYATGRGEATEKELARAGVRDAGKSADGGERRAGRNFPKMGPGCYRGAHERDGVAGSDFLCGVDHAGAARGARQGVARDSGAHCLAACSIGRGARWGDALKARPKDQAEVEKMIRSAEVSSKGDAAAGQQDVAQVTARLRLEPVALLLYGESGAAAEAPAAKLPVRAGSADVPMNALQRKTFERARANAQKAMLEDLKRLPLNSQMTAGMLMRANRNAAERARLAVEYARVTEIRHPRPGVCEVDLSLNAAPILSNLKTLMK